MRKQDLLHEMGMTGFLQSGESVDAKSSLRFGAWRKMKEAKECETGSRTARDRGRNLHLSREWQYIIIHPLHAMLPRRSHVQSSPYSLPVMLNRSLLQGSHRDMVSEISSLLRCHSLAYRSLHETLLKSVSGKSEPT